ncbi:MAG: hypothetical protein P4L83_02445 [Nevskia sp.]|nr:hypothetical protein [Nevskia sp.]
MRRFFVTMLTCADNESADIGRVALLFVAVSFVGLAAVDIFWRGHPLDYMGFGAAAGGILGGGGAGIGLKHASEPGALSATLPGPDPLPSRGAK